MSGLRNRLLPYDRIMEAHSLAFTPQFVGDTCLFGSPMFGTQYFSMCIYSGIFTQCQTRPGILFQADLG